MIRTACTLLLLVAAAPAVAAPLGYYRQPALHKDTVVFVAEGDLWKVPVAGGTASRLTSHTAEERLPAIAPDGKTVAFVGGYEGPGEVYTMPLAGGPPRRLTWDGAKVGFVGWTPDGKVLVATDADATKPEQQLQILDPTGKGESVKRTRVPLAQAAEGAYDPETKTLVFTRLPFQGSHTKRYRGGTAQNLWSYRDGDDEARPLTVNYPGTSKSPMWWQGRIYFASDRDGTMNLWSMKPDGADLKQHTRHAGWDVASPSLSEGKVAYQLRADIHVYDIAADRDALVPIRLDSDFDQTRERWVKSPVEYLTAAHVAKDGSKVALTARGRVFVAPAAQGRLVEVTRKEGVRYRDARFLPDGKALVGLSDESGEVELWKLPANGVGPAEPWTKGGEVLRWDAIPSPDGKRIAHHDKDQRLFLYDVEKKEDRLIDSSVVDDFEDLRWSPDSRWLAYALPGENMFRRIVVHDVEGKRNHFVTTDRYDSYSPAWSPDGKWLYFLSDRNLQSQVPSPWGTYQPEPYLAKKTRIYQLALTEGLRSPFTPADELHEKKEPAKKDKKDDDKKKEDDKKDEKKEEKKDAEKKEPLVRIDFDGLATRLFEVPIPAGDYRDLSVNEKALFYLARTPGERQSALTGVAIANENVEAKTVVSGLSFYELSGDGKKLLVRKGDALYVIDAAAAPADLAKKDVDLSHWALSVVPREEWRQMFVEAWRLERDYFYDRGMHGVDWPAIRKKYEPLVERVASRAELSDLLAQMVSELSALHIFVRGGDARKGEDDVAPASLGARLLRDEEAGGYRVEHIYKTDPDEPNLTGPLARPEAKVKEGDVIASINGVATLSVADVGQLLRRKAGQQVLLRVKPGKGEPRDVIVKPLAPDAAANLRYHEWEYTRRLAVEDQGKGEIGYLHLRAMGGANFTEFAKNFYPVFNRQGLIIDVRHNRGGNIDSWIIARLMRKAWFYWSQRVGRKPLWNMQYAFRGHVVVLCDEWTASDGEAFCEGIKRLKLGTVIGTRTWGGEIWLSSSNFLVDKGIATSAEFGVYGPEGVWLIEGHGVDPDVVVDNLPHATFQGKDAQLEAAIKHLQKQIKEKPVETPAVPKGPVPGGVVKPKQ
jgi:tricorn protease